MSSLLTLRSWECQKGFLSVGYRVRARGNEGIKVIEKMYT